MPAVWVEAEARIAPRAFVEYAEVAVIWVGGQDLRMRLATPAETAGLILGCGTALAPIRRWHYPDADIDGRSHVTASLFSPLALGTSSNVARSMRREDGTPVRSTSVANAWRSSYIWHPASLAWPVSRECTRPSTGVDAL
jgi:hypothetical protein